MLKNIFLLLATIAILCNYNLFIKIIHSICPYMTNESDNFFHIKSIFIPKIFNLIGNYSAIIMFIVFFIIVISEIILLTKEKSLLLSNAYKETLLHLGFIALWVDIEVPIIIVGIISGLGANGSIVKGHWMFFPIYSLPFVYALFLTYRIRKFRKKKTLSLQENDLNKLPS
ncbi:hypothetical protein [Fluviispira vulneris]|uniref:hypothetical protein n=1 Tax=Fluviispira vulneris TaxID=2763012 RepID=UPI0016475537|nr:hypothetical protein [Fluviispira vulneris]